MGLITLDISQRSNQIPNSSGWLNIPLDYNEIHTFTLANFTTETTPPYNDPDGDPLGSIKITSLPVQGELQLDSVTVVLNTEVTSAELTAGDLVYIPDASDTDGYSDAYMEFVVSDDVNPIFTTTPHVVTFKVGYDPNSENQAPSQVGDGEADLILGETFSFTRVSLTSQLNPPYRDPENNPAHELKIVHVPIFGVIQLDGVDVVDGQIIDFLDIDADKLKYISEEFPGGDIEGFVFEISDTGSGEFRA